MLSEERVKHMTKMAMYETNEARTLQPAMKYRKKDYIDLCVIANIFVATIVYAIVAAGVVGALFATVFTNIHRFGIVLGVVLGLLIYVVYLYLYLRRVAKQANKKYVESEVAVKELRKSYGILCQMYEKEESMITPERLE